MGPRSTRPSSDQSRFPAEPQLAPPRRRRDPRKKGSVDRCARRFLKAAGRGFPFHTAPPRPRHAFLCTSPSAAASNKRLSAGRRGADSGHSPAPPSPPPRSLPGLRSKHKVKLCTSPNAPPLNEHMRATADEHNGAKLSYISWRFTGRFH
ncbi:hypothetical protein SKAU_G00315040 [Synaphobranchus kaupii]|uniref:Uncharacterized protein n=1 Tax=Synaphobranchus kaupii TaxID=118154 RepID=A0A9Q1ESE3_SYNKA|nr:hypothetical protein SKAU_G00315040 [Synaphobranchus kaupii]